MFGERCLETYKIGDREAAVVHARKIWRVEELKLTVLGDEDVTTGIFKSELFCDGGDKDRDFSSAGWQAGRPFRPQRLACELFGVQSDCDGLSFSRVQRLRARDKFRKQDIKPEKQCAIRKKPVIAECDPGCGGSVLRQA